MTTIQELREAVISGKTLLVRTLLEQGIDVNTPHSNGDYVLANAVCMGDARLEITKLLVAHGADVNCRLGRSTLLKRITDPGTCYCDNERTIAFLESQGARKADL